MAGLEGWLARSASLPLVEGLFAVCRAFSVLSMQAIARAKAASRPRSARCAQPPVAVPGGVARPVGMVVALRGRIARRGTGTRSGPAGPFPAHGDEVDRALTVEAHATRSLQGWRTGTTRTSPSADHGQITTCLFNVRWKRSTLRQVWAGIGRFA
jgi:hypothetical protein